jgi:putative hemin transport protein
MSRTAPDRPLAEAWAEEKARSPVARARDIADRLGVSEGALAEARAASGAGAARLAPAGAGGRRLIEALPGLGPVMTLTRNAAAVHETTGPVTETASGEAMGQTTGPIDLRLFYRHWHAAYAVEEETRSGLRRSLQVFDAAGDAVLKVWATAETETDRWAEAVHALSAPARGPVAYRPAPPPPADPPDARLDRAALRAAWQGLEHSHNFHRMLAEFGAGRLQALRLAGTDLAAPLDADAVRRVLEGAAARETPIMCFVGNRGCLQIFSGPVRRIEPRGPWLNVLDPGFNLHLRADLVASAWRVTKPTRLRGAITSLELFDAAGTLVCQLFGARPPGEGERPAWRALVADAAAGGPA